MKTRLKAFDVRVTRWIVTIFKPSARPFFEFMTALGDPLSIGAITLTLLTAGYIQSDSRLIIAGIAIPVTLAVGMALKMTFERARPLTEYAMNMKIKTFSFPSGHSSGSTIAFGGLSCLVLSAFDAPAFVAVSILLAIIPVFVGISRVYLGAHFPSDVIAGWLLGIASLMTTIIVIGMVG